MVFFTSRGNFKGKRDIVYCLFYCVCWTPCLQRRKEDFCSSKTLRKIPNLAAQTVGSGLRWSHGRPKRPVGGWQWGTVTLCTGITAIPSLAGQPQSGKVWRDSQDRPLDLEQDLPPHSQGRMCLDSGA